MSTTLVHTTSNSLFYSAATAIIRYIYVKNSLKANITEVMKKNAYKIRAIATVESFGLYNLVSFYFYQYGKTGKGRIPFLGYQTCLDPLNSNFSIPLYKVLPANQCLLWSSAVFIVVFNILLYKYLDKRTEESTGGTCMYLTIPLLKRTTCQLSLPWTKSRIGGETWCQLKLELCPS